MQPWAQDLRDQPDMVAVAAPLARHAGTLAILTGRFFTLAQLLTFVTLNRADLAER